jgi:hypothetical protein
VSPCDKIPKCKFSGKRKVVIKHLSLPPFLLLSLDTTGQLQLLFISDMKMLGQTYL